MKHADNSMGGTPRDRFFWGKLPTICEEKRPKRADAPDKNGKITLIPGALLLENFPLCITVHYCLSASQIPSVAAYRSP